jgi:Ethylbenzene dehydrogenase
VSLRISRSLRLTFASLLVAAAALVPSFAEAQSVNWDKVPAKKIVMLYPAQTSFERLMTDKMHSGRSRYLQGKNCFACHGDIDEKPLGGDLAHAERFKEPAPIPNKPGFQESQVKLARDANNLYVRVEFDPGKQPDAGMDKDFETKVTLMFDDASVKEADRAGCWVSCHIDSASMPNGTDAVTKYLSQTRTPGGRGTLMPADVLDPMRAEGQFLEYWQARLNPGKPAVAVAGTVLEKRMEDTTPGITATATQNKSGVWTVTFSRKLVGAGPGHKDIFPGKTYSVGFAVHAGHTAKRFHYVSFERAFVLGANTVDFVAGAK